MPLDSKKALTHMYRAAWFAFLIALLFGGMGVYYAEAGQVNASLVHGAAAGWWLKQAFSDLRMHDIARHLLADKHPKGD